MKNRCVTDNPHFVDYYKSRGITVCAAWQEFEPFKNWALANGYRDDLELDRKDNDKGYSPDNCRWATRTQQMRNTRKTSDSTSSRFKGVSLHTQNRNWRVQISINGTNTHVGSFSSEEAAARAYDAAARKHFGNFAVTNFKEEKLCCD